MPRSSPRPAVARCDLERLPSPAYVVDLEALEENLRILRGVQVRTGAHILIALKGFAMHAVFPLVREYLHGVSASSLWEALLARDEFGRNVHVYAPGYRDADFDAILDAADAITFNSWGQLERFLPRVRSHARPVDVGVRINPHFSEIDVELYDPCAPQSRLGIPAERFGEGPVEAIDGVLFHALCQQDADTLERVVDAVESRFGEWLGRLKWVNFGGGHHMTRDGYDLDRLAKIIKRFRDRHAVEVYLEPGEAVALDCGILVATVLDTFSYEGVSHAVLDTSATAHMPDVLEMPYRPEVVGAGKPGERPHTFRLGGLTCLAGDVIGDYSFDEPLVPGTRLAFLDMAHYSMVKTTTFNGIGLPSIVTYDPPTDRIDVIREFDYEDYRGRLS